MVPGKPLAFHCSSVAFVEWMPGQARHDGRSGLREVILQEGFEGDIVGALDFVLFFN